MFLLNRLFWLLHEKWIEHISVSQEGSLRNCQNHPGKDGCDLLKTYSNEGKLLDEFGRY